MQEQRIRHSQSLRAGKRDAKKANQAKVVLDRRKNRSELHSAALRKRHEAQEQRLEDNVTHCTKQVQTQTDTYLQTLSLQDKKKRCVVQCEKLFLPFINSPLNQINLTVQAGQRIGVIGANGCGKSTFLKVITQQLKPLFGTLYVISPHAFLDQNCSSLPLEQSVLEQIQATSGRTESTMRTILARLGLDTKKLSCPSACLSGGERIKAALALALYRDEPAPLLLLDEPNNHLDLASLTALETMLNQYQGSLIVVSHDQTFLKNLHLTDYLMASPTEGWSLEVCNKNP